MATLTQIFRTRETDPMIAAKKLITTGEKLLPSRGWHRSSDACGPSVRIMNGAIVRVEVVSQRDSALGFDD